ncbi:MAG TPA: metallophosphoesterase [Actinomycetota bacterium]
MIRVAAAADVHYGPDTEGVLRPHLERLPEVADVLLLAGDLTQHGLADEVRVLADELAPVEVPVIAVLGNHDHHSDEQDLIRKLMEQAGVIMLEGESHVLDVDGRRLGVAGVKGFGGGFAGANATDFGEREMKEFVWASKASADRLAHALEGLRADVRIALTHYSPVKDTLHGEPPEIFPFLGSYLLAEAVDAAGADLAVHGHAHRGQDQGVTPGGIPVRNVAQPVIRRPYRVFQLDGLPS